MRRPLTKSKKNRNQLLPKHDLQAIINNVVGESSNGRTTGSGSVCEGSNPSSPTNFFIYGLFV